jgi:hypothetical protein
MILSFAVQNDPGKIVKATQEMAEDNEQVLQAEMARLALLDRVDKQMGDWHASNKDKPKDGPPNPEPEGAMDDDEIDAGMVRVLPHGFTSILPEGPEECARGERVVPTHQLDRAKAVAKARKQQPAGAAAAAVAAAGQQPRRLDNSGL